VIAETNELAPKFRKIVVTDDHGRYLIPELPKAHYKIWVRGYGLVDSEQVCRTPGSTLALKAVVAPDPRAGGAQYLSANYWYSLMQVPPRTAFPLRTSGATQSQAGLRTTRRGLRRLRPIGSKGCIRDARCATRWAIRRRASLSQALGKFDANTDAWARRVMSGQFGPLMTAEMNGTFGHDRGLATFADWSDRIAKGEVPAAPPRPQGIERNVVLTMWNVGTDKAFLHGILATNKRNPTQTRTDMSTTRIGKPRR